MAQKFLGDHLDLTRVAQVFGRGAQKGGAALKVVDAPSGVGLDAARIQDGVEQPSPDAAEKMTDRPLVFEYAGAHDDGLIWDADIVGKVAGQGEGVARSHARDKTGCVAEVARIDEDLLVFDAGDHALLSRSEERRVGKEG